MGNLIMLNRRMSEELKRFYKAKAKKPNLFGYDDDGNLIELNKEGGIVKTIPLPIYRHPTYEEFDEMEKKRVEGIAIANKEFEDAKKELRAMLSSPEMIDSEVLRMNRKVAEADMKLQSIRFPLRYVSREGGIEIRKIDFEQINETRKFPYDLYFLQERPFTLQEQYIRIGQLPDKPLKSVAEIKAAAEQGATVILFAEPETNDYGYLSLNWVVEIEFNGTMYNSAQQALYAEIAKSFNDQDHLSKIMLADTPDAIDYSLEDVPGDAEVNEPRWNDLTKQFIYDINIAKFNQYPELAGRLLETKTAMLGAYIPDDNLIGIGISLDNIQSKNPVNWTGQNLLGKALMDIREKVRSEREIAQQQVAVPQPAPRRKKPGVASVVAAVPPVDVVPGAEASDTAPMTAPVPRPIRRRPQPAVVAPVATPVAEVVQPLETELEQEGVTEE
jgi:ribA/ribD-fused uncharacterized protein